MDRAQQWNPALERSGHLFLPLLFSVVLHGLLVWLFSADIARSMLAASAPLEVELVTEPERLAAVPPPPPEAPPVESAAALPQSQIVAPPDGPEAVPDHARFLSERDSRADQETIKRGEPAPPAPPPPQRPARARGGNAAGAASPPRPEPRDRLPPRPLPGLESLFARPSELLDDPAIGKGRRTGDADAPRDLAAIARPELWADPGERGTPDYLPDVRQGSFTLLNTKADLFAPFVRRVGLRVFQTFSMDFKRRIFSGGVPPGQEKVEVEAIMSPQGRKLEIVLRKRNGNLATDRVLLATLTDQIFFDENPPSKAVAEDGKIHFLFALDASVWYGREENGATRPGAQWIFGAGLL